MAEATHENMRTNNAYFSIGGVADHELPRILVLYACHAEATDDGRR